METLNTLVRRAQVGDTRAYNAIVIRFQDMAFAYAYSFLKDFHLAQDAAQEAFIGAFHDLPTLRSPEAFASWFRRVVYKQCDRLTRGKSYDIISLDDVVLASPNKDPMAQLESQEMKTYVLNAIQVLPEEERQVVTLFYMSDYTHTEIAAFLDMPETTVNNRLRAARKRLKKGMLDMTKNTLKNEAPSRDTQFSEQVAKAINIVGLCEAAKLGDLEMVKQVVETNAKLMQAEHPEHSRRNMPFRAIHMAAMEGHADVVAFLLDQGDDPLVEFFHNYKVPCALSLAKERGHYHVVRVIEDHYRRLLKEDANGVHHTFGQEENTVLHLAVYHKHMPLVRLFLDHGAKVDRRNKRGTKPIHLALYGGMGGPGEVFREPERVIAGLLIGAGAEVDIWVASAINDGARVEALISEDPSLSNANNGAERYPYGSNFPLAIAAHSGHLDVVEQLLNSGADPNAECRDSPFAESDTPESGVPLIFAMMRGHIDIAHLLLDRGARVDYSKVDSGPSIPVVALQSGHEDLINRVILGGGKPFLGYYVDTKNYLMIRELLDRCADAPTQAGYDSDVLWAFLFNGVRACDPHIVAMCLACQPKLQDGLDVWPEEGQIGSVVMFHHIIRYAYVLQDRTVDDWNNCRQVMQQVLDYGANPNDATPNGETALHHLSAAQTAIMNIHEDVLVDVAKMLLDKGADINALAHHSQMTPLALAVKYNRQKFVDLFLEKGADVHLPSDQVDTQPLAIAEALGFQETADLLRKHGAKTSV